VRPRNVRLSTRVLDLFLCEQALALERGNAARPGGRDGLAILLVLDVTCGENALD
jgi:hypothetical protein